MLKLLKIEWLKISNYRTFIVISILFLLSVFGISYIGYSINNSIASTPAEMLLGSYFSFPHVWHTVSWLSSFALFLPGLLMILIVTNEFTYKTHRQNIIDGWSRRNFINVKIVLALLFSVASTVWVFIVALIIGNMSGGFFSWENIEYIGGFFIQSFSILMFALMISVLIKRAALSIAVFITYVYILENLLGQIINYVLIQKMGLRAMFFSDLLPINSTDSLVPFPFFRSMLKKVMPPETNIYLLLGLVAAYLVLYAWVSTKRVLSKDL